MWNELAAGFSEFYIVPTAFKLFLALICGGLLGLERGRKRHPAGLRTYMLVCMGATLVMITNHYMSKDFPEMDTSRMGAQVISGIGFLGAGTIIVTRRNRVTGLTTAAGLWAAACVGLAIGAGFYSGAILGCVLIFIVMSALYGIDKFLLKSTRYLVLFAEFEDISNVGGFLKYANGFGMKITDMEIAEPRVFAQAGVAALFAVHSKTKRSHDEILQIIADADGIIFTEEV